MQPKHLPLLSSLFVATLIVSNIIAAKLASFGGFFLPAAVIVFPVSYILSDVVTEVYGFAVMRRLLWTGFLCNLLVVGVIALAIALPSAPFYGGQEAFASTLGAAPRILAASFAAYLVGEFANAAVLAKLKVRTEGRWMPLRTILSTVVGEGLDSAIFITLAFAGSMAGAQLLPLILTQWIFKVLFETVATPLTVWAATALKRSEGIDHYDRGTTMNPFAF